MGWRQRVEDVDELPAEAVQSACMLSSPRDGSGCAQGGDVGASFVLSPERDESFAVDLAVGAEGTADAVERVLEDVKGLQAVAERCTAAARSYDEVANARLLVSHVQDNLLKGSTSTEVEVEIAAQAVTVSA